MCQTAESPPLPTTLTLEDLAILADQGEPTHDTTRHLSELVLGHPLFAKDLEALRGLARDAGVRRLADGLLLNREFDQLLGPEEWQHPAEVLDPKGIIGISYSELVHIADARAFRAQDSTQLLAVRGKLQSAWAEEQAGGASIQQIVTVLCRDKPGEAERLLHEAILKYQRGRENRE